MVDDKAIDESGMMDDSDAELMLKPAVEEMMKDKHRTWTVGDVAKILRVTPQTVRNYIRKGRLAIVKLGDSRSSPVRIRASSLQCFLDATADKNLKGVYQGYYFGPGGLKSKLEEDDGS